MQKHERKAKRTLERAGIKVIQFAHTNRSHGEFIVEYAGATRKIICSSSPKNEGAMLNGLRNEIRAMKKGVG